MTIVRVLSLGLFAGISAVACQVYVEGSAGTKDPHSASAAKPPASQAPVPRPSPASGPTAAPPAAPAPASGKVLPLHLANGSSAAPAPASGPAPAPAGACLDQGAATVGDCAAIRAPSGSCAAFSTLQQKCAAYKNNFGAKVAAAAISCLSGLSAAQLCDATQPLACAKAALAQSCPDANVAQLCQIAATPCKSTAAECASMLSGLSSQGQQSIAQCVAQGCGSGLAGCLDALK
jgi:hypothetical protein